jgi:DNA polymerase elongation subunit (family B)
MRIVGYAFDADIHCESCTYSYARAVPYAEYDFSEHDEDEIQSYQPGIIDLEKAIELEIIRDSENNPIHPIFDIDEGAEEWRCGDCGEELV